MTKNRADPDWKKSKGWMMDGCRKSIRWWLTRVACLSCRFLQDLVQYHKPLFSFKGLKINIENWRKFSNIKTLLLNSSFSHHSLLHQSCTFNGTTCKSMIRSVNTCFVCACFDWENCCYFDLQKKIIFLSKCVARNDTLIKTYLISSLFILILGTSLEMNS